MQVSGKCRQKKVQNKIRNLDAKTKFSNLPQNRARGIKSEFSSNRYWFDKILKREKRKLKLTTYDILKQINFTCVCLCACVCE